MRSAEHGGGGTSGVGAVKPMDGLAAVANVDLVVKLAMVWDLGGKQG